MNGIGKMLLEAPERELDKAMHPLIEKWSEPPKAIEVLEVLDKCIHGSLASGFIVSTLQIVYDARCKDEGTTHEVVSKLATWRGEL